MDWSWLVITAALFAFSLGGAVMWHSRRSKRSVCRLPLGAQLRIKSHQGIYRSRLIEYAGPNWVISAPLSRDNYVPLREGEAVTVEAATHEGILVVQSVIHIRDDESHQFWLSNPCEVSYFDRRQAHRVCYGQGVNIAVEGSDANLIDLSERGVKFHSWREFAKGERIHIQLPWDHEPTSAWIIDVAGHHAGPRGITEYRAIFEELVEPQEVRVPPIGSAN